MMTSDRFRAKQESDIRAKQDNDQMAQLAGEWQKSMYKFCSDVLQVKPTTQQRAAMEEVDKIIWAKRRNEYIRLYAEKLEDSKDGKVKGMKKPKGLTEVEKEYVHKFGVSIMAGRGPGKDTFASWLILYVMRCFNNVRVPATAPTAAQCKNVLWPELKKWVMRTNDDGQYVVPEMMRESYDILTTKMTMKDGSNNFAFWKTSDAKDSQDGEADPAMGGQHDDFMVMVVDEASGVSNKVCKTWQDSCTGAVNFMLVIFNPTRRTGYAYDTQYNDVTNSWVKLRWDCRDCERVSDAIIQKRIDEYGENSNEVRISVYGLPPLSDSNTVIQRESVEDAVSREMEMDAYWPCHMGVDPAGEGKDQTVFVVKKGNIVVDRFGTAQSNIADLAMEGMHLVATHAVDKIYVDTIGIGTGLFQELRKHFPATFSVNVNTVNDKKFNRLRDELWSKMAKDFQDGVISIKVPQRRRAQFVEQLSCVKWKRETPSGKPQVENKRDLRARGIKSPNDADALMMTYKHNMDLGYQVTKNKNTDKWDEAFDARDSEEDFSNYGWMAG